MEFQGGFLVSRLTKVGGRVFAKILSEQGIDAFNGPQGQILYVLWQGDGIPIREIADKTGLAVTSLTSMLDRMEAANLVRRAPAPGDRRKTLIVLTEEARGLEADYHAVSDRMGKLMYAGFTPEEIGSMEGLLLRALRNLEEHE